MMARVMAHPRPTLATPLATAPVTVRDHPEGTTRGEAES